jgi:hypothetical protein
MLMADRLNPKTTVFGWTLNSTLLVSGKDKILHLAAARQTF